MAAQTVIGFFDDQLEAQRAVEQLQSRGISRERIDLSSGPAGTGASMRSGATGAASVNPVSGSERDENSVRRTADDRTVDEAGRNTNKFTDFFNNLFGGHDNDDADRYSRVASSSQAIVTVHAQTEAEAEMAADVLDDAGAVDVDERASQLGYTSARTEGMGTRADVFNDRGSARLRSRIVDRPIEEHVRLRNADTDADRDDASRLNSGI